MSRNGAGVYGLPAIYEAVAGETILATQHNTPLEDLEADANIARPIVAGGTGATTAAGARTNLGVSVTAYELISKSTASAVATVDFTDLSAFRTLRLSGKMAPATDAVNFGIRTSTNNGSSYDAGASDYTVIFAHLAGSTFTGASTGNDTFFVTAVTGVGNAAQREISFVIDIFDFNQANYAYFQSQAFFISNAGVIQRAWNSGVRIQTTARDALRILFSSGNIAGGYYHLEGVRG